MARRHLLSIDDVLDILAIELIGVIPEDESILISSNRGTPIAMSGINGSSAGQAFRNVAQRLQGEAVPFVDLTAKSGLLNRLNSWFSKS